ncbi:hypothetical protein WR25_22563 [Diploscapter pachys]|uniref:Potassium channel domain-containing protein n=1 Tax=Diploscapter pachys TaxID=2018661 RepID=A0A2A2JY16_9BILA|nr:hypothetical protein WR25_22563 [Diploscapter pachys]
MVWHSRRIDASKKKIDLAELAPYALHLSMVLCVAIYVVAGALAIREIEATPIHNQGEARVKRQSGQPLHAEHDIRKLSMSRTRRCVLEALQQLAKQPNCTQLIYSNHLEQLDKCYEQDLLKLAEIVKQRNELQFEELTTARAPIGIMNATNIQEIKGYQYWTIMESVLFCFTVVTTIGYGNVAPKTFNGRLFVILYGLIGVPVTMLAIANLGKFLATLLKSWTRPFVQCYRRFKRRYFKTSYTPKEKQRLMEKESKKPNKSIDFDDDDSTEDDDDEEPDDDVATEGMILFVSFIIYIVAGSIVIAAYEPQMDFFEAIYFNFVTLTTIGLGDLVPQSDTYLVITLIYCAVGLALTTIAIEIAADALKKLHYFGRKMENVGNVQVWFGGKKISMKALVKNLGDQFNVPIDELDTLNLDKFVDDAIKVEQGELATLRTNRDWMNSNYWQTINGDLNYIDEVSTLYSYHPARCVLAAHPPSRSVSPSLQIVEHAPINPTSSTANLITDSPLSLRTVSTVSRHYATIMSPDIAEDEEFVMGEDENLNGLMEAYRNLKKEQESREGRWSLEAQRRYEEYKKMWKKYKHTREGMNL